MKSIYFFILFLWVIVYLSSCSGSKVLSHGAIGSDKSLYYHHKGKGKPIIFVHGGPGLNHRYFLPHMDTLSSLYHTIYFDQRSSGDSETPADTNQMRLESFINDINIIKGKFKLKKFHLIAHSWGNVPAIKYAALYSDNLLSYTLLNPASLNNADNREASKLLNSRFDQKDQMKRNQIIESADFKSQQSTAISQLMKLSFAKNMAQPELIDQLNVYLPADQAKKSSALKYLFKDLSSYDLYPFLNKITCPVMIVYGEKDAGLFALDSMRSSLPSARIETIKNAGHFPFLENRKDFFSVLIEFLHSKG